MNNNRIEKGDIVKVYFSTSPCLHNATVDYVREKIGDHWILLENGKPVYVDNYARMDLIMKYDKDKTSIPINN